jgi:hypothetical protein
MGNSKHKREKRRSSRNKRGSSGSPSSPSQANDRLDVEARRFAGELADLLNGTITTGLRVGAILRPEELAAYVGYGVSRSSGVIPSLIPVTLGGTPSCWLSLSVRLQMDPEGHYLTVATSEVGLHLASDRSQQVLRYDYDRTPSDDYRYPPAHLHAYGSNHALHGWMAGRRPSNAEFFKLHLPVGGRRYRPCLEDLIEMLIVERLVEHRSGWQVPLNASRERWYQLQLKAAVRRDPEAAMDVLKEMGLI